MSAAAIVILRPAIPWVRTPRPLNFLSGKGLTPGEKFIWEQANHAIQLGQEIVVSRFAAICEVSERFIQLTLAKLVRLGLLLADPQPGKVTVYSLPHDYLGPRTPEQKTGGTSEQTQGGAYKERARATVLREIREKEEERTTTTTNEAAHASRKPPATAQHALEQSETKKEDSKSANKPDKEAGTKLQPAAPPSLSPEKFTELVECLTHAGYSVNVPVLQACLRGKTMEQVTAAKQAFADARRRSAIRGLGLNAVGVGLFVSFLTRDNSPYQGII